MTKFVAKTFGISISRANRIVRTFWQAMIGLLISFALLIANAILDILHGQSTGAASAIWTAVLTVIISLLKNIQDNKREYGDASGTSDTNSTGLR